MTKILTILGLGFNLLGAVVLSLPFLKSKMWLKDDFIVKSGKDNKGEFWYQRSGIRKIKRLALAGVILLALGFIIQMVAQFCFK